MSWDNFKNLTSNQQNQASTSGGWYNFVKTTNPQILINQQKKIDKFHQGMSQTFKSAMQAKREEELRQQQIRKEVLEMEKKRQNTFTGYSQAYSQPEKSLARNYPQMVAQDKGMPVGMSEIDTRKRIDEQSFGEKIKTLGDMTANYSLNAIINLPDTIYRTLAYSNFIKHVVETIPAVKLAARGIDAYLTKQEKEKGLRDKITQELEEYFKDNKWVNGYGWWKQHMKETMEAEGFKPSEGYDELSLAQRFTPKHLEETLWNFAGGIVPSMVAFAVPVPGFGATAMYVDASTEIYNDAMDHGVDKSLATDLAGTAGVVMALLEKIVPDDVFSKGAKKKFLSSFVKNIIDYGQTAALEGVTEISQEAVQMLAESTYKEVTKEEIPDRLAMSFIGGLIGGAGFGLIDLSFKTANTITIDSKYDQRSSKQINTGTDGGTTPPGSSSPQQTSQSQQQITQPIQQPQNQTNIITPQETTQKAQTAENKPVKQETKAVKVKEESQKKLDSVNPTGSVFESYDPKARMEMELGENITTLDKTMGKSGDEKITIYRGVSKKHDVINPGDFVTTNKQLAQDYAGDGKVVEKQVRLKDILDDKTEPLGEEYIYRPQLVKPAETSSTKSKDQISDKEQGVSVKQKEKSKKKDVLPKKVIVGKVQPQTKQATKAKPEAKPTPKKKVKKQLSEKSIKELTKQNKDNAEMAKAEIERLKAKESLTENEKATLKAYEETLKQSNKNLKELKQMEEQVKQEEKQETKQEVKQETKKSVYNEVAKPSGKTYDIKNDFEYHDSLPKEPRGSRKTVKIIGANPSPNDMIVHTDKGSFQRNSQTRYKKVLVKVLTEGTGKGKIYKVVDSTGQILDTYDGSLQKQEVLRILKGKGAEFINKADNLVSQEVKQETKQEVKQETKPEVKPEKEVDPYAKPAFLRKKEINEIPKRKIEAKKEVKPAQIENKKTDTGKFSEEVTTVEKRAVERYTGVGYGIINKALRAGKEKGLPLDDRNAIKSLDKVIEKYVLEKDVVVFRGVENKEIKIFEDKDVGDSITLPAFTSTSFSEEFAKKFVSKRANKMIIEIEVPAGKGIGVNINQIHSYRESEQEFLLKRGIEFIITEKGTVEFEGQTLPLMKGGLYDKSKSGQTERKGISQGIQGEISDGNRSKENRTSKQGGAGGIFETDTSKISKVGQEVKKAQKISKETQVKNPKAGASYGGFAIKQDHNWSDAKDIAELKKRASNYKTRIKTPELIAFSQILGADPTLSSKLTKKLGVFWHNDGEKGIKINKAIVNDPLLLNMVLSHEIGHLIDWLPTGFIKRSSLLTKVMTDKAQMRDMFNRVLTNNEVKEELKKLTQKRNPFDEKKNINYTRYRYSAKELYAEYISELLTNPQRVKELAPKFDKLWLENIAKKPEVSDAYLNLLNLGATGEYLQVRSEKVRMTAAQAETQREEVLAAAKEQNKDILTTMAVAFLRKDSAVRRDYSKAKRLAKKQGVNPAFISNPIYALENLGYKSNIINGFKEKYIRTLSEFMSKNNLDVNVLHEIAMYDRIIHERGAVTNPAQLAMERMGDEEWSKFEQKLPEDIFEMSATEQYKTFKRALKEKEYETLMSFLPKDGGIANPFGFDHDTAKESREYLKKSLGNEWDKYQEALKQVREFNKEVINYAQKGGFYTPEAIAMMKANPAYASFQVIDYVGTKLTAAVKHQTGTFKGIANTIFSTFEKNLSIINAVEINNAKKELVKFYQESLPEGIKELGFRMGANRQKIFDKVSNSNIYGEIILYDNGVQKAYQVDKLVADIFTYNQRSLPANAIIRGLRFMAKIPRAAFINFNIGFQIANVMFRDPIRYFRNNPFTSAFNPLKVPIQIKNYFRALPIAVKIVKGQTNATIENLRNARILIEDSIFNLDTRLKEIPEDRVKMQKAFQARFGMENTKDSNLLLKMLTSTGGAFRTAGEFGEMLPKIAGYLEYQDYKKRMGDRAKFSDQEAFSIIRNRLGSPNYQNKAGLNAEASSIMLFYNAIKEGILSDIEAVMDKKTRTNTLVSIGIILIPTIINLLQGMGEMGDEDKELMDSISEYDKRNYNILLLGRAQNGKAIYARLPLSDSERMLRAIAYEMFNREDDDTFHDYVKSMSSIFTTVTEAVPGFNPVLKAAGDTKTYLSGENIWDSFYQDTVFSEEDMAVGGMQKFLKFKDYTLKNLGASLYKPKTEKTTGEKEPLQKIAEAPIIYNVMGRFLRYTSSGEDEILRNLSEKQEQEQLRQTAREKQAVKQEVARYKAGELTLNEAKKQAVKQVLGNDLNVSNLNEEQKKTLKRVEDRFLRESVADKYEKKLKAVYYTSKKEAKLKVLLKAMEKMSKEEVREMLREGTRTGLISQPVSDEAWREFNKQSQ